MKINIFKCLKVFKMFYTLLIILNDITNSLTNFVSKNDIEQGLYHNTLYSSQDELDEMV